MKSYKRSLFIFVTVLAILIQLTNPTVAYADDGAPPPTDTTTDTTVPEESPVVIDTVPAADTPAPDAPAATEETLAEIVEQIPAGTDIVVVNDTGEVVPLATQEAAEIIVEGDPMWCPANKKPGDVGCSISYTTFNALLTAIGSTINADGTIWITSGATAESSAITINGATYVNWATHSLTIQGGWNGVLDSTGTLTADGTGAVVNSAYNVPITITNWTGAVTVNNITVNNAAGTGLKVTTAGDISVNYVTASNNTVDGAFLQTGGNVTVANSSFTGSSNNPFSGLAVFNAANTTISDSAFTGNNFGAYISTAGAVNISSSTFSNNALGLSVHTAGNITLANVTASSNTTRGATATGYGYGYGYGAYLNNTSSSSGATVTLTGVNEFSSNHLTGLYVRSDGVITLDSKTIIASNNLTGNGLNLDNTSSVSNAAVTLNGSNEFSNNYLTGLYVRSDGAVTANNITANNNVTGNGANIDNTTSSNGAAVTLTGNNIFNGNNLTGLYVRSDGDISASNIAATYNRADGADINNSTGSGADITLTGKNTFNNNSHTGLNLLSNGSVTVSSLTVHENGWNGVNIGNQSGTGNILLTGSNSIQNNLGIGINLTSKGNITIENLNASGNQSIGAYINNTAGTGTVSLTGTNIFVDNKTHGLYILSNGNVALNEVTANGNGVSAASSSGGYGAYINNTSSSSNATVTLNGINEFSSNYLTGLYIRSSGNVTASDTTDSNGNIISASKITASNNVTGSGVNLDNTSSDSNATVTLDGTNIFNGNYFSGLYVRSDGNITANNVAANDSVAGDGADLNNSTGTGYVSLTGNNTFNHNGVDGLYVTSKGNINISNLTAGDGIDTGNGRYGAYLNNSVSGTGTSVVSLTGTNTFNNNTTNGLYVLSAGDITISKVTANNNGNIGVFVQTASDKKITIKGITANENCAGLYVAGTDKMNVNVNQITGNGIGVLLDIDSATSSGLHFVSNILNNTVDITGHGGNCVTGTAGNPVSLASSSSSSVVEASTSQIEFDLSCQKQDNFFARLPNGDKIQIFCPVSGKAFIKRLDNTMLPADLPDGYTYASAFSLDIVQGNDHPDFIHEGGNIKASFQLPDLETANNYSILYWDAGKNIWVPLKGYLSNDAGDAQQFDLYDGDNRVLLSGANLNLSGSDPYLEVSTNFPGIFVLVQR